MTRTRRRFVNDYVKELLTLRRSTSLARVPMLAAVTLAIFLITPVYACDPNEECNRCLASAFGHCITHGNDPICEARKAACQVAPPVVNTPGSPFAPGGVLGQGGPGGISMPQVYSCLGDLGHCPQQVLAGLSYNLIRPILDTYIGFLQNQAGNNVYHLDDNLIAQIQQFYSVDLRNVLYATNINTIHGANVTIGNTIYFVKQMDFNDPNDGWTLYHELEHVVQYANRGGVDPFLAEYVLKATGSVLRGGNSIDMHDNIDLENAANAKANQVAGSGIGSIAVNQGGVPTQPHVGGICRTFVVVCPLAFLGTVGTPCWCPTSNGPATGIITAN